MFLARGTAAGPHFTAHFPRLAREFSAKSILNDCTKMMNTLVVSIVAAKLGVVLESPLPSPPCCAYSGFARVAATGLSSSTLHREERDYTFSIEFVGSAFGLPFSAKSPD